MYLSTISTSQTGGVGKKLLTNTDITNVCIAYKHCVINHVKVCILFRIVTLTSSYLKTCNFDCKILVKYEAFPLSSLQAVFTVQFHIHPAQSHSHPVKSITIYLTFVKAALSIFNLSFPAGLDYHERLTKCEYFQE